jgi:hypothetical protein
MSRFMVKATVTVDVEMSVEAIDADDAEKIFSDKICMTASLVDIPADNYRVDDDVVSDTTIEDVSQEDAGE